MDKNKETLQAERLDMCVAEMEPLMQEWFSDAVKLVQKNMANGGGEKSAKALLYEICRLDRPFGKKEVTNSVSEESHGLAVRWVEPETMALHLSGEGQSETQGADENPAEFREVRTNFGSSEEGL